jgi:putative CocE/NonD family hydrolase
MGPWTHGDRSTSIAGDVDFGEAATLDGNIAGDYRVLRLAWFRRWLQDTGSSPLEPPVQYFRMGGGPGHRTPAGRLAHGGRWLQAECWPPPGTSLRRLYFHADGSLCDDAPASASILEYRFDPHDPVPTIGGAVTSGAPLMRGGAFDQRTGNADFTARDVLVDQPLAVRPDVLIFESPVLQEDLVICGAVVIRLFVSSDCPDTDFTAKLVDCYPPGDDNPDGYAMNITDGIFRMRYREGWDREVMLQPDAVYEARIEPFATCNLFAAGHRLRIDISSSNFPMFDVNPNTGAAAADAAAYRVATNRLHIGASPGQCSELLLPVAPASGD